MAKSKYEPTAEEQAKLGLTEVDNEVTEVTNEVPEGQVEPEAPIVPEVPEVPAEKPKKGKNKPADKEKSADEESKSTDAESKSDDDENQEKAPEWFDEELKETLKDYFDRHDGREYFYVTDKGHIFYEVSDVLSAFREPSLVKFAKIIKEWVK